MGDVDNVAFALYDPGENLEEMLDNQEFRRVPGDGDFEPTFNGDVLSKELLLEGPGRVGIGLGGEEVCSFATSLLSLGTERGGFSAE